MAVWSCLKNIRRLNTLGRVFASYKNASKTKGANFIPVRMSHENRLLIAFSKYPLYKTKDLIIFYILLGVIPIVLVVSYVNIFIGPAELAVIPEGYEPKYWEYYRHPITRFIARYLKVSPQEQYERNLHNIFVVNEISQIIKLKKEIKAKMREKLDYQSWYFEKPTTKYNRKLREDVQQFKEEIGTCSSSVLE